jgi:hypothetical protein
MPRKPIASAKPGDHRVLVNKRVWVYGRVRKKELTDDESYFQLMKQVAKVTLRRVIEVVKYNKGGKHGNT